MRNKAQQNSQSVDIATIFQVCTKVGIGKSFTVMKAYKKFEDLLNRRGYGVVFYQQKDKLKALFRELTGLKLHFCQQIVQ